MLKVEYLIFNDNQSIKCSDAKTFNNLLQTDPDITINRDKLTYQNLTVDYIIKNGKIKPAKNNYFHLSLICDKIEHIDEYDKLLKAVRSILHILHKEPQTLYDGVSLYYAKLAYPKVFETENLMRKLITKFMFINVGIGWHKERVPEEVKISIKTDNKDLTFLHNVDFIQLKHFLFSENYPIHKENLFREIKKAKDINDLNFKDIKSLIPSSNWDRYFSDNINITRDELSKNWDKLYELRCKIAHNRTFSKTDYKDVENLCIALDKVIINAIDSLNKIDISDTERELLTESIATNFNYLFGEFVILWNELEYCITYLIDKYNFSSKGLHFLHKINLLHKENKIDESIFLKIRYLLGIRNEVVHNAALFNQDEILKVINEIKLIIKILKS